MEQRAYFERGLEIIRRLNELTYEAYLIGGVVRDFLLQIPFTDIDIATSATPAQVLETFPKAQSKATELGCLTLKEDVGIFEITTFRIEEYTKTRKPSQIHYSTKLNDDIPRRDFTINGLAMSASQKIIDFCKGEKDLKKKLIRTINKPKKRFKEDPLRILRAFNLIAHLNFSLEKKTKEAIEAMPEALFEISEYWLSMEMIKIFTSPYGQKALKQMKKLSLIPFLPLYGEGLLIVMRSFNDLTLIEKLAICYLRLGFIPNHVPLDRKQLQTIDQLMQLSKKMFLEKVNPIILYEHGLDMVLSAEKINKLMNKKYRPQGKNIFKAQKQMINISSSELAFKGHHLVELTGGKKGPFIGEIIETLKQQIIMGILPNHFNVLQNEAIRLLAKYNLSVIESKPFNPVINTIEDDNQLSLFNEYKMAFNQLYNEKITKVSGFITMSKREQEDINTLLRKETHQELVLKNPEYKIFEVSNNEI